LGQADYGNFRKSCCENSAQLKKYQKVLATAKQRDIGEADTVTIITDFLCDALGYDKYKEVSSEHAVAVPTLTASSRSTIRSAS
jgi:hypothetical protein